jgi:O-antigen/teichoic acid export membrane protein
MIGLVFPPSYSAAADALGLLSVGMGLFVVITALTGIFQAMHHPRIPVIILMLAIVADIISLVILVPKYGILGAAASTTIACIIGFLGLAGAYWKYGFIKFDLNKILNILISYILFGALVFILPHVTKLLTIVDLLISSILYVLFLFLLRLLNNQDIKMILSGFKVSIKN